MRLFLFGSAEGEFGSTQDEIKAAIREQFQTNDVDGYEVLAAWSSEPDYEMSCWFLLRKDGVLYEAVASHCSCNGYEEQFDPGECPIEYLVNGESWRRPSSEERWPELLAELQADEVKR